MTTQITILNTMAGLEFESALNTHLTWGLKLLDLKDEIFGKRVIELTNEEAKRAAEMIRARQLSVYCLSTTLFDDNVELGEAAFRQRHLGLIPRVLQIAQTLRPRFIRLIAAKTSKRQELSDSITYIHRTHPWLFDLYNEAIELISNSGFTATIENEVSGCILSNTDEILSFFDTLGNRENVCFTWDVVNLWQAGTFPSLNVYESLKPIIGYYHLKGGRLVDKGQVLQKSSLEHASWPIIEITRKVIVDNISPVICLNPPHGIPSTEGENHVKRDLAFIRQLLSKEAQT